MHLGDRHIRREQVWQEDTSQISLGGVHPGVKIADNLQPASAGAVDDAQGFVHLAEILREFGLVMGDRTRDAGFFADTHQFMGRFNQCIALAAHVRDVNAVVLGHHLAQLDDFLGGTVAAPRIAQPGRHTESAFFHRFAHQLFHPFHFLCGGLIPFTALAVRPHHTVAYHTVRDVRRQVDADALFFDFFSPVTHRTPVDLDLIQRNLSKLEQIHADGIFVAFFKRIRAGTALAYAFGGDPGMDAALRIMVVENTLIAVCMQIAETGRYRQPFRIDDPLCFPFNLAGNFDDLSILYCQVSAEPRVPAAVDNLAVLNDQVVHGVTP